MSVKLLTEHHLEFLNFKGGCTGSSEATHVKMPHCWKSNVMAHLSPILWVLKSVVPVHLVSFSSHSMILRRSEQGMSMLTTTQVAA